MVRAALAFIVIFDLVAHYCDIKVALGLPNTCKSHACEGSRP